MFESLHRLHIHSHATVWFQSALNRFSIPCWLFDSEQCASLTWKPRANQRRLDARSGRCTWCSPRSWVKNPCMQTCALNVFATFLRYSFNMKGGSKVVKTCWPWRPAWLKIREDMHETQQGWLHLSFHTELRQKLSTFFEAWCLKLRCYHAVWWPSAGIRVYYLSVFHLTNPCKFGWTSSGALFWKNKKNM